MKKIQPTPELLERFWSKVDRKGPDECWNWTAYLNDDGYGYFKLNGMPLYAHRVVIVLEGRRLPDKKLVHHTCQNSACVNPKHLQVTDHLVNNARENMKFEERPPIGIELEVPGAEEVAINEDTTEHEQAEVGASSDG